MSPWLSMADPVKFGDHVDLSQNLDIDTVAACHTPVLEGRFIDEAFAPVRELPTVAAPPLSDRRCSTRSSTGTTAGPPA